MKKDGLSFSESVKEESAREIRDEAEKRSLLSAFLRINGYLRLSGGQSSLDIASESSSMAKAIYLYLHDLYGVSARFAYTRSSGFLKRMVYHVMVETEAEDILNDLGIDYFSVENPKFLTTNAKEVAAYLTGAFWAKGSVNAPQSSSYHLEISLGDESYAKWVARLWQHYPNHPFNAKVITKLKRNTFHDVIGKLNIGSVVYPKYITAEMILTYVRGLSASMDYSNIRTLYHFFGSRVEAIEFEAAGNSKTLNIPLKDIRTKDNLLIAGLIRGRRNIIPGGDDAIRQGDRVIVVTTHIGLRSLDDIIA